LSRKFGGGIIPEARDVVQKTFAVSSPTERVLSVLEVVFKGGKEGGEVQRADFAEGIRGRQSFSSPALSVAPKECQGNGGRPLKTWVEPRSNKQANFELPFKRSSSKNRMGEKSEISSRNGLAKIVGKGKTRSGGDVWSGGKKNPAKKLANVSVYSGERIADILEHFSTKAGGKLVGKRRGNTGGGYGKHRKKTLNAKKSRGAGGQVIPLYTPSNRDRKPSEGKNLKGAKPGPRGK